MQIAYRHMLVRTVLPISYPGVFLPMKSALPIYSLMVSRVVMSKSLPRNFLPSSPSI